MQPSPLDPWATLGLSRAATHEEIKGQWRRLCKQHHPDLQPAHLRGQAEQYFKEISSAYRTLCSRGSNLATYADFTAAAAAAHRGSPFGAGFRTAWAPGGSQAKFSNGVVAAVLFIPLVITCCSGMWMAFKFDEEGPNHWRPHGLLAPPENPFLREDMRPKVNSHVQAFLRRRQAEEDATAAAAAAAAALGGPAAAAPAAATAAAGGEGWGGACQKWWQQWGSKE